MLALPGRTAAELVSTAEGGYGVTVRRVVIPSGTGPHAARGPHRHEGCEEVIVILSGSGEFTANDRAWPVGPGDVVVVSPGEPHRTRNTGDGDLVSLCFFAVGDLAAVTSELPAPDGAPAPVDPAARGADGAGAGGTGRSGTGGSGAGASGAGADVGGGQSGVSGGRVGSGGAGGGGAGG